MLLSESDVRAVWLKNRTGKMPLPSGAKLTPAARDFLRAKNIEVVEVAAKPEYMTHLRGTELIKKTDALIAFRGELDSLLCEFAAAAVKYRDCDGRLSAALAELVRFARSILVAEVKQKPLVWDTLLGLSADELRDRSHFPQQHFGVAHRPVDEQMSAKELDVQRLRALARRAELAAVTAFTRDNETVRTDIITALNRLSSALYIMAIQTNRAIINIPVGVSNRHAHLSMTDLEVLFGRGYQLTHQKDLSQPGQFAAAECIDIAGPKGNLEKVRILGPVRSDSQVEVSVTDSYKLGLKPFVRDSGQVEGSAGAELIGPNGRVRLKQGVIIAARHVHMTPEDARKMQLADNQKVSVLLQSPRPAVLMDVLVRVRADFALEMHLDTDEANAVMWNAESTARITG